MRAQFLLLLKGHDPEMKNLSAEQVKQIMSQYDEWSNRLKAEGAFRAGAPLKANGRQVKRDTTGSIVDGPYAETKELLSGYIVIEAKDMTQALSWARDCPALNHGESVDVIELSQITH